MKTIKNNITVILLSIFLISTFISCDEGGDPDPGATSTVQMAGDWFVQWDGQGGYYLITTYNTAADNGTEMWIDDNHNFWDFKAKCPVSLSNLSFSGDNLESSVDGYDITVSIANGSIVKGGAETSGGNTSDLISFDIEFSDDPGTIYSLVGYKRTGFAEDDH